MYTPATFAQTDSEQLFALIESHSFGLLISAADADIVATHLPFLVQRHSSSNGRLIGHLARANPQWRALERREVLCIFSGPHAYVSPSWYETENVVPTWNYLAVHVYGTCRLVEDPEATARIVGEFVATYEQGMPSPWHLETGTPFFDKLLKAIVGFEIDITRIEGKWKLGQNQPAENREKAAMHLSQRSDPLAGEIARLMRETLD